MTVVVGIIIVLAILYYIIKSAVKNGIIEAHNYIKELKKNEKDFL